MTYLHSKEFHEVFGHPVNQPVDDKTLKLRYKLISEELFETSLAVKRGDLVEFIDGLADLDYVINGTLVAFGMPEYNDYVEKTDPVFFKAWIDDETRPAEDLELEDSLTLINAWIFEACGYLDEDKRNAAYDSFVLSLNLINRLAASVNIDLTEVVEAVHSSNMSKLGADGKPLYNSDGKVIKGPNYEPPTSAITSIIQNRSTAR